MNRKLTKGGHTSHFPLRTSNRGITLIALVITIIVLLILAGVTISMVLGDDGIILQAQEAKKANEESSLKDAVSVAKGEAALAQYVEQTPMSDSDLSAALGTSITDNKTVAKVVEGVPIPVGFAYVEGTKKDTGLIVVDSYGNEYVWVPIDTTDANLAINGATSEVGSDTTMIAEETKMKASVKTYGGFYVGRYETSWTGTKVASVPNETAMSGSTIVGEGGANWYTFYTEQKKLHEKSNSVVSGMIYGSQWDAIMDWMSDVPNPDSTKADKLYITDSTAMGNYNPSTPIKTGSNPNYAVKNIYDLAGNYSEWSQEAIDSSSRVSRGGYYFYDGFGGPASGRSDFYADSAVDFVSSRLQLYIE